MDISVCIVNLNAKKHLINCIRSIPKAVRPHSYEIIVADNHSSDGSGPYILKNFPFVHLLSNNRNIGYTTAMNRVLRMSRGDYKVILNPDTVLMPHSITLLVNFLKQNNTIGIVGPKVVNDDGTFQRSCRRGIARPVAVFSYFFGMAKMFPNNKNFTEYHLNHLDENELSEVGGVSGSCMIVRNEVIKEVGLLDERYFAYQEDSDYCIRAKEKGWGVYYNPESVVKHSGGKGGANSVPFQAIFEWHRSYFRYYFKHFSDDYSMVFNCFYSMIMLGKLIFAIGIHFIKR